MKGKLIEKITKGIFKNKCKNILTAKKNYQRKDYAVNGLFIKNQFLKNETNVSNF